jgi:hypothetical protein
MSWAIAHARIVAELSARASGSYDERTPKMSVRDMVAFLAMYTPSLAGAITRVADRIVRSDFATSDGVLTVGSAYHAGSIDTIDAMTYLSTGVGLARAPWKRSITMTETQTNRARLAGLDPETVTYEPVRDGSLLRNDQTELISFARQAVADYDKALSQISSAVWLYPSSICSEAICKSFVSALRALSSDLEVLAENPPTSWSQDVSGALGHALDKSEAAVVALGEKAGAAAGRVGNLVGDVAGKTLGGFLDSANLLTLAVAGAVAYVVFV